MGKTDCHTSQTTPYHTRAAYTSKAPTFAHALPVAQMGHSQLARRNPWQMVKDPMKSANPKTTENLKTSSNPDRAWVLHVGWLM